ncbi:tricorn protease [Dysgonomonas sp. PH5-45]|uniref:S41 family peptidase n=1 Tax=unclassified Dysgonomonas TaxID=2630389 RepID=UPI00247714DA|nr:MULTISPECIES: S41 family peptidase [unclassified Dysgonomonas]MDH6355654.1 tricorn protease [Dysgonomonas sp. PH5-45]MDH6388563.1 tricorn protease [Dysgonomonas sp. PH5-37]
MRKIFLIAAFLFCIVGLKAQNPPLWLRYCAISPDGGQIAFCYKGDIYKVPVTGGRATQLTTHPAHDTRPVWSPDGQSIAFSSNREGSFDVFIVSAEGGVPRRLTTNSVAEYPVVFRDATHVLFSASIIPDVMDGEFPSGTYPQIYEVSVEGGRPTLFSSLAMENISFNPTGSQILYHDQKGYEDPWRKHHQSSIARDIWIHDLTGSKKYTKLTTFRGEDRNPVWATDGKGFYYLSEQEGSFNVYKRGLNSSTATKLTNFSDNPVRFLTASNQNILCFAYDGQIYTLKEGAQPQKVNIQIVTDNQENKLRNINFTSGAREMEVSPDGKEVAFIIRGDIFVASVEYGTTRRITNTPDQERNVSFCPDGRSLLYASERNGLWNIYQTSLTRKDDKSFVYAQEFKEEQLTNSEKASFQPLYSPDGKEVAYLEDRTTIRVLNIKSKKIRTVLDGKFNYSYADGDQWFRWSPDGKWILTEYIGVGGWNNVDIALVKADGSGEVTNLTESGYSDGNPRFVQDGKAMLWFSDRAGYRSHGSWGAYNDAYIMFFDREAYDKFRMSKEELALLEASEKKDKEDSKGKKDDKNKEKDKKNDKDSTDKKKEIAPLKFDLENRRDWVIRLTPNSSSLADAFLNKKGDKLYYLTRFEKDYDLWVYDLKDRSSKILAKATGSGRLLTDKDEKNFLLLSGGQLKKVDIDKGTTTPIKINAQFEYQPEAERSYIFEHAWKQVKDKFYVTDLHGADWDKYRVTYERFLPHINNNFDFAEMLSELLGELNGSHTGARYFASGSTMPTASLGAFFDNEYDGDGIKIKEIIGQGPLTVAKTKITEGTIITKIDGQPIEKGKDYYPLLAGKAGKKVLLAFKTSASGKEQEEWVKPISYGEQSNLLYKRWIEQRRQMVDKLSGGRIGYVHVKGMDSNSFREVYSELLGRSRNKEAVIVDTRHNGGGWLHDDLVTLLSGKEYQRFEPRGQYIGSDPFNKWLKPSAVLVCEDNYSNAHGFPWLYKELGIGKLIGTPVPGTMTAVWWENQIDPTIVFGIPQVAVKDMRGQYLENQELQPDIEVYNDPASVLQGRDMQLERAVRELLK